MTASEEDSSALLRRPSELNAATDLVGLSSSEVKGDGSSDGSDNKAMTLDPSFASGAANRGQPSVKFQIKEETTSAPPQSAAPQGSAPLGSAPQGSAPQGSATQSAVPTPPAPGPSPSDDAEAARREAARREATASGDAHGEDAEKTAFPTLLHEIVSDPATDECIHWLACGTRFMISDKKKFAKDVLPRFYGQTKFTSFTRRLKRWSFTRVPSGPFMGAYYNPNFRKGEPELAARVRYDHPSPLSGAAMQLNMAKPQAVGGMGMAGGGFMNPMLAGMPLSDQDREMLLRQMNMMNGGAMGQMGMMPGATLQAGGSPDLGSLYLTMSQNAQQPGNLAANFNSVALQMAMAQEMMQQRQAQMGGFTTDQARLLAQQQQMQQAQKNNPNNNTNQMSQLIASTGVNAAGDAAGQQQGQAGQGAEAAASQQQGQAQ